MSNDMTADTELPLVHYLGTCVEMMGHLDASCWCCRKVTNLADGVTDDDIKELFESCGPVKYAAIEWDRR